MSRNRIAERSEAIYAFLLERINEKFTIGDLIAELGLQDSRTTRKAIRRAADLAENDGMFLPIACPANGFTYCVTDDPENVVDPTIHLSSIANGVEMRKDSHADFLSSNSHELDPLTRELMKGMSEMEEASRKSRDAYAAMTRTMVAMRREARKEGAA